MKKFLALIFIPTILFGCASVFKGGSQVVSFSSDPDGAEVIIDGQSRGETPLSVSLKKNKYSTVTIKKKGYKTISRPLEKSYDVVALLNITWDSSTTDLISGAAYEYEPNTYHFKLSKGEDEKVSSND
ncbi:MAG: hypothetical protein OHK0038_28490 [Flammeovirgaceae bacterium]